MSTDRRVAARYAATATLCDDSPLRPVFPEGMPIRHAAREEGLFAGEREEFVRLDWGRCAEWQRIAVAAQTAELCNGTTVEVLRDWEARQWLPVRRRHVAGVAFDARLVR
jgi:hypothetical protein